MASLSWHQFEPRTFEQARKADRPVLLLITKSWCPHSKRLLETTLTAAEVLRAIEDNFIAIQVDAERRPDVNERYGCGSWPTLAYLTPEGELISNDGFLDAEALTTNLDRVTRALREKRAEIEAGLRSLWHQEASRSASTRPRDALNEKIVDNVTEAIYERFDHRYGGWGDSTKFPHSEAIDFALVQVAKRGDDRMREVVTLTLDKMTEAPIHDAIDGGFFRYSKSPDWRSPDHEKVLDANAMRLRCYLEAFQVFGKAEYRRCAEGIVDWMTKFLLDSDTGGFFGSVDPDPDYYALDREGRASRGAPRVDRTIYANWNAMAISSLFKASLVLDRPELRDVAMRATQFVLRELYDEQDGVFHYWDGTYHLPGMLSDQAYVIRALIDASQHAGDADFLLPAERIADLAIKRQRAEDGGFFDILRDPQQPGSMQRRNRSILENAVMAEALLRLSFLVRRPEFHDEAVSTLEKFASDYKEYGYYVAGYARAVDLIFYEPLTVTIVGRRDDPQALALRDAALSTYVPSRIVQTLDPEHDPILLQRAEITATDRPTAYLALGRSPRGLPAHTPEDVLQQIESLEAQRRA